jgi:glycosyltransferase involved in cell wall biosynthesis
MDTTPPLKLLYAAYIRLPTEKAHGAQIMHTCASLARQGCEVTLAIPGRKSEIKENPFSYYAVEENFNLVPLSVFDFLRIKRLGFLLSASFFALRSASYARRNAVNAVYTRDRSVALLLSLFLPRSANLFFEVHGEEPTPLARFLSRRAGFVGITQGVKEMLVERGVPKERVAVAHDGVEVGDFENVESNQAARTRLGLPLDKKVVMYAGRLDGWKGTDALLEASKLLPQEAILVVIGGETPQIEALKPRYPQVRFLGYHVYRELPGNLAAADVLVLPNTAKSDTSRRFTSPLKLFGYMASGMPIVASDLPSLREIVSERSAFFAVPDEPASLARAIGEALSKPDEARHRAQEAKALVQNYSWDARAKIINSFISNFHHD